ncbi:hypothetical protein OF83DRAFT_1170502 [Amylostereum chailletii]|nr:hypothetical protein OF83DRAFT_1170502 [Amylostereum chailletii]
MTALQLSNGTENWDDDFVFQPGGDNKARTKPRASSTSQSQWAAPAGERRRAEADISIRPEELSSANTSVTHAQLQSWAEPGPSTPPKHATATSSAAENWDDDFEDKADSPAQRHPSSHRGDSVRSRRAVSKLPQVTQEPENWDEDFEEDKDTEEHTSQQRNNGWDSSDEEDGLGFADQEEDKTVTARSRRAIFAKYTPPPPVPPLPPSLTPNPSEPFPRSPTLSAFSIPSGRDSVAYSSASHLPLRAGSNSALAMLPPSPPIHRERRRLRKKSRPPDTNVFELLERTRDIPEIPTPPTPPDPQPDTSLADTSMSTKTPLLSRIGSVKKWRAGRKRMSTGPAEVIQQEDTSKEATPRASNSNSLQHHPQQGHSSSSPSSKASSNWFFRGSGGHGAESASGSPPASDALDLRHERSIGRLKTFSTNFDSPTKPGKKIASVLGSRPDTPGSLSEGTPPPSPRPRRPSSMQVPAGKPMVPRQTSHGVMTVGRSASRSTFSTSTDDVSKHAKGKEASQGKEKGKETAKERDKEKDKDGDPDGHRGFINGMRRLSLVAGRPKHKRNKSTATLAETVDTPEEHSFEPPDSLPQLPPITPNLSAQLLPPIELQPPSPPRAGSKTHHPPEGSSEEPAMIESLLLRPSLESVNTPKTSPTKATGSPQSASLGRSTQAPSTTSVVIVPRRNSLGDLKIPARISQAQVGIKRDLGMVREFAAGIERLKELQAIYQSLVQDAEQAIADGVRESQPPSRATSPIIFNLPRPRSRARSNATPSPVPDSRQHFASSFYIIEAKYKISWECAELLIELGGGTSVPMSPPPPSTMSAPDKTYDSHTGRKNRERAVTLAGDEQLPPVISSVSGPPLASPPLGWRASTGRNDLSQRQLGLLKEMLNRDPSTAGEPQIPEEIMVNRNWKWGDAMSSTITLPSEESQPSNSSPTKKRRSSRLGMRGIRDMLKSLASGGHSRHSPISQMMSSASVSTDSSLDGHGLPRPHQLSQGRRRAKTSAGPDSVASMRAASPPYGTSSSFTHKSPRRPSIASIFRFAQKTKPSPTMDPAQLPKLPSPPQDAHMYSSGSEQGSKEGHVDGEEEEDWDHLESAEDLDAAAAALGLSKDGTATVRGRKTKSPYLHRGEPRPITPKRMVGAMVSSQSSLSLRADSPSGSLSASRSQPSVASAIPPHVPATFTRPTRLSNVEEVSEAEQQGHRPGMPRRSQENKAKARSSPSPHRHGSRRGTKSGSVRSAPPQPLFAEGTIIADPKLAMTPENIRPLLHNAREVHARCVACIDELKALFAARV